MRLNDLCKRADIALPSNVDGDIEIQAITADSRAVREGTLFVAVKGVDSDGADFIPQAISLKASAIIVRAKRVSALSEQSNLGDVPVVGVADDREALSALAAAFYAGQPEHVVAVTGTNGKSSVAEFYRQLCALAGAQSASVGTLGLVCGDAALEAKYPKLNTSPDPVTLHRNLSAIAEDGITHLCLEASSHGLDQKRMDGLQLSAGAFTNLSRDHLDYHHDMDSYFDAKGRLFSALSYRHKNAVLWMDDPYAERMYQLCLEHDFTVTRCGTAPECELRIVSLAPHAGGLHVTLSLHDEVYDADWPLYGNFQVYNILIAMGLVEYSGIGIDTIKQYLTSLYGVRGRMEKVAEHASGAPIFVDYAHTPDALETVLKALRPHTEQKLHVVFGCGGDRDAGKRPQMGAVAAEYADVVIVTDDNPRSEDPATIRDAVMAGMKTKTAAHNIAGREQAIQQAIKALAAGDLLVIAGKGHETTQEISGQSIELNDASVAREAIA